jgi:hypothetical protein
MFITKPNELQKKIVVEFLDNSFDFFETCESRLTRFGVPTKSTYQKIVNLFKKAVPNIGLDVRSMSVELEVLYEAYRYFCSDHLYTLPLLKRQQFSRCLKMLTLHQDHRELIIYRYSRKQYLYVFPLPKKLK